MELKLRKDIEETYIYEPFTNTDVIGKFIDKGLYPHLYKLYPELFEVILDETDKEELKASKKRLKDIVDIIFEVEELKEAEEKKTIVVNDILINDGTEEGGITE